MLKLLKYEIRKQNVLKNFNCACDWGFLRYFAGFIYLAADRMILPLLWGLWDY